MELKQEVSICEPSGPAENPGEKRSEIERLKDRSYEKNFFRMQVEIQWHHCMMLMVLQFKKSENRRLAVPGIPAGQLPKRRIGLKTGGKQGINAAVSGYARMGRKR